MIDARLRWNGAAAVELVKQRASANARRAATLLHEAVVDALSTPAPPASRPGEPPHRRRGDLVRGVLLYLDAASMRWTVAISPRLAKRARALELGTRAIRPRPFLSATVLRMFSRLQAAASGR